MLNKINRQACLNKYPFFPQWEYDNIIDEEDSFYPKVYASYIFTLLSKSFKGHIKLLGEELSKLTKDFGFDTLIFLGEGKPPWLYQDNEYKPVKEAQQFLIDNKVGKKFNGGFQVDTTQLPTFVKHLSWLTRCNASLPFFHFTNREQLL